MKKLFLSLVAAIVAATATYAQNTLVATLTHGENVTMYYGTYALRDAHNAAVSGDIINLSGGGFQAGEITKAVSLRGVGINATVPTSIINQLIINIPSTDANRFSMEGIRCNYGITMKGSFENPQFLRCWITRIETPEGSAVKNVLLANCRVTEGYMGIRGTTTMQFINSFVSGFYNYGSADASFINCVITPYNINGSSWLSKCQFINCIFYSSSSTGSMPSSSVATNCIAINDNDRMSRFFNNSQVNANCGFAVYSQIFKNFTGDYSDSQTFELTDEAKTTYLGNDGTEVGMYGGVMPYTDIPSYPQITKMNVANKTTADGKLSVEIEVSAAE